MLMPRPTSWWEQAVQNRLVAIVLAMIAFVPLIATPLSSGMPGMRGAAALAYEGMGIVLLAALLWRAQWKFSKSDVLTFVKTGANLPVLLFAGLAGVSCLFAPYKPYAEQELLRVGAGVLLYFAVAYQFRRSEYLNKLVDTLLFVTICGALLGFVQYGNSAAEHALGLFGDHQLFGSFLMILLPLAGVIAISEKNANRQLVAQIATVLAGTALLLSQARSAWLGAAAGLATLAALALWTGRAKKGSVQKAQVVLPVMLLVVSLGFFLLIWPQSSHILSRATTLENTAGIQTWQIRQHTWQGALQMIRERPLTGWGLGQYAVTQSQFTHEGMALARIGGPSSLGEQAHNVYIQTTAELGAVGLSLLVGLLVTFLVSGIKRVRTMDAGIRRNLLLASLAGVVAFAVDACGNPSWQCGQVSMFLWLTLGVGTACMRPQARGRREEVEERAAGAGLFTQRFTRLAAVAGALGGVLLLPTITFAAGTLYATPVSARIFPINRIIRGGASVFYQLFVMFSDNVEREVTFDNGVGPGSTQTSFSIAFAPGYSSPIGPGFLTGPNNNTYQSRLFENGTVFVTGTYTQQANPTYPGQVNGSASSSTRVTIHYP